MLFCSITPIIELGKPPTNTMKNVPIIAQICKLIPGHMIRKIVTRLADEMKEQGKKWVYPRAFCYMSHIVSMIYLHIGHAQSITEVCDALNHNKWSLNTIRNAKAPRHNTLSNANRTRSPEIIKRLYYALIEFYQKAQPDFFKRGKHSYFRVPRRIKRVIRAIDSTTIELVANCMDWAKHRRQKAAAKLHVGLDLDANVPFKVISEPANTHDNKYMVSLTEGMKEGQIAVFDKAYMALAHLRTLTEKGIIWVTRCKENAQMKVVKKLKKGKQEGIISDELVEWKGEKSHKLYPARLRRVQAWVKDTEGNEVKMTFLTNNEEWAARSVCDLYRTRWAIEIFFKEIKQSLQLKTFIGYNRNAIEWQIWSGLVTYLLLRIEAWLSRWEGGFKHFCTLVKTIMWQLRQIENIVANYGTAGGKKVTESPPETPYLCGGALFRS